LNANWSRNGCYSPQKPSFNPEISVEENKLTRDEIIKLENYLRKLFDLQTIEVRQRPNKDDSAEVYIGDEFIGIMFRDDDDGDMSYQFQMAILDFDLQN
jgi:Protein of unknown function (DUF3126)